MGAVPASACIMGYTSVQPRCTPSMTKVGVRMEVSHMMGARTRASSLSSSDGMQSGTS
jgi:hypothetical protein